MKRDIYSALTIAGSDSGGGAGIQADLKTFEALGVFGTSAITALTAQNTESVEQVYGVSPEFVAAQIAAVVEDIPPRAVKTGMLASAGIVETVAACCRRLAPVPLVIDPVMVATSGDRLLEPEAEATLIRELLPLARVVTPNLAEASVLAGFPVRDDDSMLAAARTIRALGPEYVLVKGGHGGGAADDLLWDGREGLWLRSPRLAEEALHGTGCTFSAALAAGLALGLEPVAAARLAKKFISAAISARIRPGRGAAVVGWQRAGQKMGEDESES